MTDNANIFECPSGLQEAAQGMETLMNDTKEEIDKFKAEQVELRSQINAVVADNQQLSAELGLYKETISSSSFEDMQQRVQYNSEALQQAQKQIELLQKERNDLLLMHKHSQTTIESMVAELQNYRLHMSDSEKQQYAKAIKLLEARITSQQEELKAQSELINKLHNYKQRSDKQMQKLQEKLQAQTDTKPAEQSIISECKSKIHKLERRLEKANALAAQREEKLQQVHTMLAESSKREKQAMVKVQDAITLTEAAVSEKDEAENKALLYKEQINKLAENIGVIMDEAAKKVDKDVGELRDKLVLKDQELATLQEKLAAQMEQHKSEVNLRKAYYKRLDAKYKETLKLNDELVEQVTAISQRFKELEFRAKETQESQEQIIEIKKQLSSERDRYLNDFKQVKARYKEAMEDLTRQFEKEFHRLTKKNDTLQAENAALREGVGGDSSRY